MGNNPPPAARDTVRQRAHQRCERCLIPAPHGHLHHRRSRSVIDPHTHCPCNMVWLCGPCHVDVHGHPFDARRGGWIVSRHVIEPGNIVVRTPLGERVLYCNGGIAFGAVQSN